MSGFDLYPIATGIIGSLLASIVTYMIGKVARFGSITVPIWIIGIVIFIIGYFFYLDYKSKSADLETVYNKNFGVERVILDGKEFVDCKFDRSELVFLGKKSFRLIRTKQIDTRLSFEEHASLTVTVMKKIYGDPGIRQYIVEFIKKITEAN